MSLMTFDDRPWYAGGRGRAMRSGRRTDAASSAGVPRASFGTFSAGTATHRRLRDHLVTIIVATLCLY
jgi:hypothetical protein